MTEPTSGRSSALVASGIFLSRIAGLVRESVLGAFLGTGPAADAFRAALRIPNLLQNLLGEGVLSAAFIPVYARRHEEGDEEAADRLAGAVAGLLTAVTLVLVVVAIVLARPLTAVLAPGFTGETYELTVRLMRIMTAGIGFLVLSAWCLGVLNTHRRFFLSYVAPVLWNVTQIAVVVTVGLWGWAEQDIAVAAAWGVFAGGIAQFLVQVPTVRRVAPGIRLSLDRRSPDVREVGRRFVPAVLGRGVVQVGAYVDLILASLLATGAVAALGYAQVLYLLPVSLFAMSVAAAELPELSRAGGRGAAADERYRQGLDRAAFYVVFTAVAYVVAGDLIVAAVFERGEFGPADTRLVWLILAAYALGLPAIGASRLTQNLLYARGDVAGPARIAALRVGVAALLGVVLMFQLDRIAVLADGLERVGDLPAPLEPLPDAVRTDDTAPLRAGAAGLALGSAVGAWLELALLRRRVGTAGAGRSLLTMAGPAAVAGGVLLAARVLVPDWPALVTMPLVVGAGGLTYVGVAVGRGVEPARALVGVARRRLRGPSS